MKSGESKRIVIVDGYSTARDLLPELLERNVECLHLQSTEQLPTPVVSSFNPASYDADLGYLGDAEAAAEMLAVFAPHTVIAGSEWGVTFAEEISHRMDLPTNRIESIHARRDKFDMIETVRQHGLRAAEQAHVSTAEAAHAWADRHAKWPIVVKPMASAGSDGVTICSSHVDIDIACAKQFGCINFMGLRNRRLLLQSYLTGPQFIVNAVSQGGRHYVTDIWSQPTAIRGSVVIPQEIDLLDPNGAAARALMDYTLAVLAALGIENSASHTELKWTPEGPTLIETGARLMGAAMDRPSYRFAGMESQAMVYAGVLAGSERECDALFAERHYKMKRHMTKLLFEFKEAAEVRSTEGLARLRELPSFHAHYRPLIKGSCVWKTADWLCCGGVVYLIHDDRRQIAADIEAIRRLENRGELYGLVTATADAVS